ncbi:MAG: D-alanyl-D-alanine carboxypeptidase family protein [Spirochaetales bacterium]
MEYIFRRTLLLLFFSYPLSANPTLFSPPPSIRSLAAVLMDATSGEILYAKNADLPHPPASLTKVLTIHILLSKIKAKEFSFDTEVPIPMESWAVNLPPDSSLMFLGPRQKATVKDILLGLAVASGNDAAIAAAYFVDGSVSAFAERMNREVQALGLQSLHFVEPSGYDANNRITAREFAQFLKYYLETHPESLESLHKVQQFTYPRLENLIEGNPMKPITQYNRNSLIFTHPWVDGIKTGFLYESGFNLAATASQNGMRLLVVLLGATAPSRFQAIQLRNQEAIQLLEYGFANFTSLQFPLPALKPIRVWKGSPSSFLPKIPSSIPLTIRKGRESQIRVEYSQTFYLEAPVSPNTNIGKLLVYDGEVLIKEGNLQAGKSIPRGSTFRVLLDTCIRFFRTLLRLPT